MGHFIVSICCSFMEGVVQAQSRWSAQYNILTVSSEGHWDVPMHSFHLSFSHLSFIHAPNLTLSSTFLLSVSVPLLHLSIPLLPHSSHPPTHPSTHHHHHPWLWSYNIHFCHLCPSALISPQGDDELRAVTDKFLFCSWCWVKQRDVGLQWVFDVVCINMLQLKSKTETGGGRNRQILPLSSSTHNSAKQPSLWLCNTDLCRLYMWVNGWVCVCVCKRVSLCLCSSLRESGKKLHIPQHPVRPWGHSPESLLPQTHFNPFVNTVRSDMFTKTRVGVCTPVDVHALMHSHTWAVSVN